jgi:hypothetical protein
MFGWIAEVISTSALFIGGGLMACLGIILGCMY